MDESGLDPAFILWAVTARSAGFHRPAAEGDAIFPIDHSEFLISDTREEDKT